MIEDQIRSAFEHIDEDASDEFRDALHARLLAELVGEDTNDYDESNSVVSLTLSDAESVSGRRWPILIAAAAVVLVVGAIAVVATRNDDATPADQPSPTVTVPPTLPPQALFGPEGTKYVPGTYFLDEVDGTPTPRRIFVTIGDGWWNPTTTNSDQQVLAKLGKNGNLNGQGGIWFGRPVVVFSDACHASDGNHPGTVTTLDGLVAALTEQRGWADVTDPTDISINGYTGKAFQRTAPVDMSDCDRRNIRPRMEADDGEPGYPDFRSWEGRDGEFGGGFYYEPGQIETLWVLDIDGTVVLINAAPYPEVSAADRAEFDAVLDSIRIGLA